MKMKMNHEVLPWNVMVQVVWLKVIVMELGEVLELKAMECELMVVLIGVEKMTCRGVLGVIPATDWGQMVAVMVGWSDAESGKVVVEVVWSDAVVEWVEVVWSDAVDMDGMMLGGRD